MKKEKGKQDVNFLVKTVTFLVSVLLVILVYTIFMDGPDLIRGSKTISTISIFNIFEKE